MNEFDIIVVGSGPAGSTAATLCARRGLSVALIEQRQFPRHKVCGDVINPNCWPILDRLGVADEVRALPQQPIRGARFCMSNGATLDVPMRAVAIRRSLFDATLLAHARASGVVVFENESVCDVTLTREVVTRRQRYRARQGIIGADGRHSLVARRTGLTRGAHRANGHVAFQAHFHSPPSMDDYVQLHLFPRGYCGIVRVDNECINACVVTDREGARAHRDVESLFARTVWQNRRFRALGISPVPMEPMQSVSPLWRGMHRPCREGVWLIGDALRVVEPFTGQGIFFALRTAEFAAESVCDKRDYASAVRALYRRHARTNQLLRRLMYHERAADLAASALRRWPAARHWLAANVLAV